MVIGMPHPWIPNSAIKVKEFMMKYLGISDVMELFNDVPKELMIREPLNVGFGRPLTEYEVRRKFLRIMGKNKLFLDPPLFIGGGFCLHHIPSALKYIISRGEFYTAYTPYQAEINQGVLQALFEYQSMMAELYGVDVVNASMYNGSTAAAEAVRMALRVKRNRKEVVLASTSHPEVVSVIETWLQGLGVKIRRLSYNRDTGESDVEEAKELISKNTAAVYIEYPNFFGIIEKSVKDLIELAHDKNALVIIYANPLALGIFKSPGELGADIVVGDTQPLGMGLNYGGPTAGILGIKYERDLLRQLPGRLIGATKTYDGHDIGFMMILQTREQHIRRERATSNITTNSALTAIAAAIYLALLGSNGIRKLGEAILGRTYYAIKKLSEVPGIKVPAIGNSKTIFFREFTIAFKDNASIVVKKLMKEKNVHIGPPLSKFFTDDYLVKCSLVCVTEVHTKDDIDYLANSLKEVTRL